MSSVYIATIPQFSCGDFANYRDYLQASEPCLLTLEDVLDRSEEAFGPYRTELLARSDVPPDALLWANILFEPEDILELRGIPPKSMIRDMAQHQFYWNGSRKRYLFQPWVAADRINLVLGDLAAMNSEGITTYWGDRYHKDQSPKPKVVHHVPLNIYCSANPRKDFGGTTRKDVLLARSLFVDLENTDFESAQGSWRSSGLPDPTMVVKSGHGIHLYWRLVEPIYDLSVWTEIQKLLIQLFSSDPAIHDPARVMRIPGFLNLNGEPTPCTVAQADPTRRYDLKAILPSLPSLEPRPKSNLNSRPINSPCSRTLSESPVGTQFRSDNLLLRRALAYVEKVEVAPEGERNIGLFRQAARLTEKFDLSLEDLLIVDRTHNGGFDEPLDEVEVQRVVKNAFRHVHESGRPRGTLVAQVHEPHMEPEGIEISLDDYRAAMASNRLESLERPGEIFFDRSVTGSGKSTADQVAMTAAGRSLVVLPTHDACEELVETLKKSGLAAAAYPPLDSTTCQRFGADGKSGDAFLAQASGLNVGEALCPDCHYFLNCEYQKRREEARNAPHAVATHARAGSSGFDFAEKKPIIFVHEDPLPLLRPMLKVTSKNLGKKFPCTKHLKEIVEVTKEAADVARKMGDVEKEEFFSHVARSTKELLQELGDEEMLTAVAQGSARNASLVKPLPLKESRSRPDRCDLLLYRAIRQTGIDPNGDAMRLALGYACGEVASLCLLVENTLAKGEGGEAGGRSQHHMALLGVWRVDPPTEAVVWFEDATGDRELLADLLGRPIHDMTPEGRLNFKKQPVQYASLDVTKDTSGNVVRGVVRGLLARHPEAHRVGLITQRDHIPELETLEPYWRKRISRIEYYLSGKDRASNSWLDCDLIVILGTPRVPPTAVRDGLIRLGRCDAAGKDGRWGPKLWEGKTPGGEMVMVRGLGYADPSWDQMHKSLVRATLLQAIGRGRGVTEHGVSVVVISNENINLPLLANLPELKDPESKTFMGVVELTAKNAKDNYLGEIAVSTTQITKHLSELEVRQVRNHLNHLNHLGLLAKKGARGGWLLTQTLPFRQV